VETRQILGTSPHNGGPPRTAHEPSRTVSGRLAHLSHMETHDAFEPVLSTSDLAKRLHVSVQTLYDLRSRGRGPRGFRVGRELRFRLSEVEAWLRRLEEADGDRHRHAEPQP